ncbi:MAG: hypothetical protein ACM3SQ_07200, partial [Betaproteobacteria bacterium]
VQDRLRDSVILSLTRLSGPARSTGKDTACFESIIRRDHPSLESLLATLREQCTTIKAWRNQRIAHRQFQPGDIEPLMRREVAAAIDTVEHLMNEIGMKSEPVPCDVEHLIALIS